jgi:hypothetical protein
MDFNTVFEAKQHKDLAVPPMCLLLSAKLQQCDGFRTKYTCIVRKLCLDPLVAGKYENTAKCAVL